MPNDKLIRLESVTKDYRMGAVTVHAVRGLDLCITRGELVILLGPSGCGKTTTVNLIGGLDQPTSGQVVVQGQDITQWRYWRHISQTSIT